MGQEGICISNKLPGTEKDSLSSEVLSCIANLRLQQWEIIGLGRSVWPEELGIAQQELLSLFVFWEGSGDLSISDWTDCIILSSTLAAQKVGER